MQINKVSLFGSPGTSASLNRSAIIWLLVGSAVAIKAALIFWLLSHSCLYRHDVKQHAKLWSGPVCATPGICLTECDQQHKTASCNQLVNFHEMRVVNESPRTIAVYRKACAAGNQLGCDALGDVYRDGTGITQDYATAAVIYARACESGEGWSCSSLGYLYQNGWGVAANATRAHQLYVRARVLLDPPCRDGNAVECDGLAHLYEYGWGVAQDTAKAVALFQQACRSGNLEACDNLGIMFYSGQVDPSPNAVELQKIQATRLFQMACEGGHNWGCRHLHYATAQNQQNHHPTHHCVRR